MYYLSGPAIHIGVSAILAFLFRLNPIVTIFCGVLPDLIDKPPAAVGIGGGRYIGHTLLFAVVVSAIFFFWKNRYGLAAIVGLMSHLLLDLNAFIPWFYPFKHYDLSTAKFDFIAWVKQYLGFYELGYELLIVTFAGVVILLFRWLYHRHVRRE